MTVFTLHPRLAADTVELARWPMCRVLLMNDANYPWLILVPQKPDLRELHHLSPENQATLMAEVSRAARALETVYTPTKINVAALGNVVEQLHVHVIARFADDAAWPGPIWGKVPVAPYDDDALRQTTAKLKAALE